SLCFGGPYQINSAKGGFLKWRRGVNLKRFIQVTEQTCIALIKINTGYLAEFHNLHRLLRLCECFSEKPYHLFLSNAEDERLFGILLKSYSATRYNDNFTVTKEDSEHLYKKVHTFLLLSVDMCNKKIEQLKIQADYHRQIISEAQ
ncbi:hypothetical protein, partial [Pedobacter suwonensis]|uniref:hypothetical protein n=1 Tax=Pedobacter suwonensis TaxID=332999 RepID=UPI00368C3DF1